MGRALATIDTQKNGVALFHDEKNRFPGFPGKEWYCASGFYIITFSRCKPFSLGSHLLDYYKLSSKQVELALPYPIFSTWKLQSRILVAAL